MTQRTHSEVSLHIITEFCFSRYTTHLAAAVIAGGQHPVDVKFSTY